MDGFDSFETSLFRVHLLFNTRKSEHFFFVSILCSNKSSPHRYVNGSRAPLITRVFVRTHLTICARRERKKGSLQFLLLFEFSTYVIAGEEDNYNRFSTQSTFFVCVGLIPKGISRFIPRIFSVQQRPVLFLALKKGLCEHTQLVILDQPRYV